jgi:FkbM family methyltransferase
MSVVDRLRTPRSTRLLQFVSVGAVGMVVDFSVSFALLGSVHYLLANAAGFLVAVSHNFAGNYIVTYGRPDGSRLRQYLSYVSLHSVTFGARALVLTGVVEALGAPAAVGTVVGVGVATALNFIGAEHILGGRRAWLSAVEALNRVGHAVYSSRLRGWLVRAGIYTAVFRLYTMGLSATYRSSSRTIEASGVTAELATEHPTETVSVLHTATKEGDILDLFAADVQPGDHVLDVGANVGVFSALAAEAGANVTGIEPHAPTADRLRHNCPRARVHEVCLGGEEGTVRLAIENDRPGTQRPSVGSEGMAVPQVPGDELVDGADVVKIDVEGAEVQALDGLAETLAEARVVWVECHGETEQAVRDRLTGHGFDIETVASDGETHLRADDPTTGEDCGSTHSKQ